MKRLNLKMIVGILTNAIITVIVQSSGEYGGLGEVMWGIIALNLVGIALVLFHTPRIGAWIIIISCIFFIPIGAIGVLGGKQVLNELEQEDIDEN